MFYCEPCRKARSWPTSLSGSRGPCELCGVLSDCYDRPSSSLPAPVSRIIHLGLDDFEEETTDCDDPWHGDLEAGSKTSCPTCSLLRLVKGSA